MSSTVDIGAARVRLIVDAADFQPVIDQGKNAITGFGTAAQASYDKTEKATRRAADALLDYVNSIGRADTTIDKYVRNASRLGVEKTVIDAATEAWARHNAEVEDAARLSQQVASQTAFITSLQKMDAEAGKTRSELLALKAAELGVSEAAAPFIAKMQAQEKVLGANGVSAGQLNAALRGLPAQFTDVVVSLQGGQRPLTVLLQQGGQIKDMFGGVGNAVKAVAGEIGKIVTNPWVLLAAAVAAVGFAAYSAQSQLEELAVATAKGNQVAGSAQGLSTLATQLGKLSNISMGNADAAVSNLAAAGKLTGTNFEEAAQATARWATITGAGVDDIAAKFTQLANDPMAAVLDGTLRVTAAQYEQLAALDRVGDKVGEVALAVKLYQDQVNANSDSVLSNLTDAEKGWNALKDSISNATHELGEWAKASAGGIFNGLKNFGKGGDDLTQGLVGTIPGVNDATAGPGAEITRSGFGGSGIDPSVQQSAAKLTTDQVNANKELQKTIDDLGTKQQKYSAKLQQLNALLSRSNTEFLTQNNIVKNANGSFSGAGYDKLVNGLKLQVFGANQGGDPTKPIKEYLKTIQDAIKTSQDGLDTFYADGNLSAQQYYSALDALAQADKDAQLTAITQQIAALKGRENSESQIAALQQQRQTVEQAYAKTKATNDRNELLAITAKKNAFEAYVTSLADANNQLSRQGDQAAAGVGMGSRQQALAVAKANAIYAEQLAERQAQQAVDALPAGSDHDAAQATADQQKTAAAAGLSSQLDILQGNYDSLSTAEASYLNGSKKAWQDWQESVSNNAAEASKVFTSAMDGVASSIADAALTGKNTFGSLLTSIEREIITFGAKQGLATAFKSLFGSSDTKGNSTEGLLSSLFSGSSSSKATSAYGGDYSSAGLAAAFGGASSSTTDASSSILKSASDWVSKIFSSNSGSAASSGASSSSISGIFSSVSDWFSNLFSSTETSSGSSSSSASGYAGLLSSAVSLFSAKGNAFSASAGLSGYSNSVVSQPTYFPFAKGGVPNVGLMGEKSGSPGEAIMPLTRTSGGELAVKTTGQQGGNTIVTNQTFVVPGAVNKSTQDQISNRTYSAAQRAARRA